MAAFITSHVHMSAAFKPLENAAQEVLAKRLAAVPGIRGILTLAALSEFHADLEVLTFESLTEGARAAGYELQLRSHPWIDATVATDHRERFARALDGLKGVLVVPRVERPVDGKVSLWASQAVSDGALKRTAEGVGLRLCGVNGGDFGIEFSTDVRPVSVH